MATKKLSILFMKDGFSFCILKDKALIHAEKIVCEPPLNSSYYEVLNQKLQQQIYLNQTYDQIQVAYLGNQFNIIPNAYFEQDNDAQKWLEFNAEVFEGDQIQTCDLQHAEAKLVYAYPQEIAEIVKTKFNDVPVKSGSELFINSLAIVGDQAQLFLNVHPAQIEILVYKDQKLQLYNIFEISTKEDIVYYVLNGIKQLDLDPNTVEVYYFGWETEDPNLKMLMNFVRHVMPGTSEIMELKYYTETQNLV